MNTKLELNAFIKRNSNSKYIIAQNVRIALEYKPIALTKAVVCWETTCY